MKKPLFLFLLTGTLVMMGVISKTGASLKTSLTPHGIINLEFAHNAAKTRAIINVWAGIKSADNIRAAKLNTWLDFIFIFFYSLFLFYLCKELAASTAGFLYVAGNVLANGSLVAGLLDILENTGILISLSGHITNNISLLTAISSIVKWALVLTAVVYILFGLAVILYKKYKPGI